MSKIKINNVLSICHSHIRDKNIHFKESGHIYTIVTDSQSKYTSVTTWIHSHFHKFDADSIINKMMTGKSWKEGHKYWGLTSTQIKDLWNKNRDNAASAGTDIHYEIECFMNNPELLIHYSHKELYEDYVGKRRHSSSSSLALEWSYFLEFVKEFPTLKPYRTEWMIYHEELKLAGSIDMVYENPDGTLSIYDWKRSANITKINTWDKFAIPYCISHLPDSNFWHYTLQLNTYKTILERKYGKKVSKLCLVRLHPNNEDKTYEILDVPILEKEMNELFEGREKQIIS
jgi:ATP-dependent exoDNAse (exonuclease V) beta subunit